MDLDSTVVDSLGKSLTSDQMADIVKNATQNNFFMYAFIVFAFIMIVGIISIVSIFSKSAAKKDVKQSEQYKDLIDSQTQQYKNVLDGYTKMIDQNALTNTEFRKTIDGIGNVLRDLTKSIVKNEALSDAEDDKVDLMFKRMDNLKEEISRSNASLHQAFREHQAQTTDQFSNIDQHVVANTKEMENIRVFCKANNNRRATDRTLEVK